MRFCSNDHCMLLETSAGSVRYTCPSCGETADAEPHEVRIAGGVLGETREREMHATFIRNAAHDRAGTKIRCEPCPDCRRDYVTMVRVGEMQAVFLVCMCGRKTSGVEAT